MANNKVQLADGSVLIDLTDTTAVASDVAQGKYFYGADGVKLAGAHTDPMANGTGTDSVISVSTNNPNTAAGDYAFAAGRSNDASGDNSIAMGYNSLASGLTSIAIGGTVSGKARNQATQAGAVAIGQSNQSSGYYSVAMGREAVASGTGAVALGYGNTASGNGSFAAGGQNVAGARCSTAIGLGTEASGGNSLVAGKYNEIDDATADATTGEREFAVIVGNGMDDNNRSNAMTLDWDGNAVVAGKLTLGAAPTANMDAATKQYVDQRGAVIPTGACDSTSTATVFTATVSGITELRDGVCIWLKNGVVTSASGCTLNINSLGAKPIYASQSAATAITTQYNINYTALLIYNSTRISGGCWDYVYGYEQNTTYTPAKLGFGYATCSTAEATVAKTAALSSYVLNTGGIVSINFTNAVPANATLNINSKGAKAIYYKGSAIDDGVIEAGDTATFIYSTYYHLIAINKVSSSPSPSSTAPVMDSTAAVGSSTDYARADHVHPTDTSRAAASEITRLDTAVAAKADKVTEITVSTAGAVTQALDAGKIYHFTGALTSLTITLNAPASGQLAQYHFDFLSGSTAPTLTMPNTVTMPDSFAVDASKRYEIDVLNNYGVVASWANS